LSGGGGFDCLRKNPPFPCSLSCSSSCQRC
jgi:hypothetical protein